MSAASVKCPVCGGFIHLVKVQAERVGRLTVYKCICQRCDTVREGGAPHCEMGRQIVVLEGFEDAPAEPVSITHQ